MVCMVDPSPSFKGISQPYLLSDKNFKMAGDEDDFSAEVYSWQEFKMKGK